MFNKKRMLSIVLLFIFLISIYTSGYATYDVQITGGKVTPSISEYPNLTDGSEHFMARYKNIAVFIGGLATITMVGAVIYNVFRLNMSGNNPMQRQQSIRGMVVCSICVALLGGATLFIGLFWGLFQ